MEMMLPICVPSFMSMVPFASLRSEEVKVPEVICCCLQTCIVVFLMLVIEYIMHTKFRLHSSYHL